jgi:hypothetical protein
VGIITEVKLQMTPPSNTKAVSINLLPDANIAADVTKFLQVRHQNRELYIYTASWRFGGLFERQSTV